MTLYLDMDGVLMDYEGGIAASGVVPYPHGKQYIHKPRSEWPQEMIDADAAYVACMARDDFWLGLKVLPDAKLLWGFAKRFHHHVLTALPNRMEDYSKRIADDKRLSLRQHFGYIPDYRIHTCLRHEKASYARPGAVLVDDTPANCEEWNKAGGTAVHHKDSISTIRVLNELGYK